MPHIITGEIRKEPFTQEGNGNNGAWKRYSVDMSERYKDKDGNPQYTNYRATFFANDRTRQWYDEAFQKGKVISVTCDSLEVQQREHNGTIYVTLEMKHPNLTFSQRGDSTGGNGQQSGNQQGGWGQPQQPQQPQQPRLQPQQQSRPQQQPKSKDFDDDIPF